jgi:MarR family transcriptional regulator, transcriptional regulator for hemolysin
MVTRLGRRLIAVEQPILAEHGVTMWGYIVLSALARADGSAMRTQAALARAIGADKTRIIPVLDDLQERGYIERQPDPADRRVHLLALSGAGRDVHGAVRAAIRREEERLLGRLPAADRAAFLRVLQELGGLGPV